LVGVTAFTSQAPRAYELAAVFRDRGVRVVMGGIHASMCVDEALQHVDAVVTGEADEIWPRVVADFRNGALRRVYNAGIPDIGKVPPARHDLLPGGYAFGSIQTTRGCPLDCTYCSVTAFNGKRFRWRPIEQVIEEFKLIKENLVLIVDDNLIGISRGDIVRAKELFRAMIDAKIRKKWICQVTVNMGEDEELVRLAARAGCFGAFVGFETLTKEGLAEINKRFNIRKNCSFTTSCRRMQRHGIVVHGAFIMGLDVDQKGIGRRIADAAISCGVNSLNVTMMTPLPGTRLWEAMEAQDRITANSFPDDWKYYTLGVPVASYMHLSWAELIDEWTSCLGTFYSYPRIVSRFIKSLMRPRRPISVIGTLVTNVVYRRNLALDRKGFEGFDATRGERYLDRITRGARPVRFAPVGPRWPRRATGPAHELAACSRRALVRALCGRPSQRRP
jgi:radical SAM superfamily enzyme YgiQ (UPF0313 family)